MSLPMKEQTMLSSPFQRCYTFIPYLLYCSCHSFLRQIRQTIPVCSLAISVAPNKVRHFLKLLSVHLQILEQCNDIIVIMDNTE